MQPAVVLCQRFLCKRPLSVIATAQLPAQNEAVDRGQVARDIDLEHVGVAPRLALIIIDGPLRAFAGPPPVMLRAPPCHAARSRSIQKITAEGF